MSQETENEQTTTKIDIHRPRGQVLKGQYVSPIQSDKGKLKGLVLQIDSQRHTVKLPKHLRSLMHSDLKPETWMQVWAYPEKGVWRAIALAPSSKDRNGAVEAPAPLAPASDDGQKQNSEFSQSVAAPSEAPASPSPTDSKKTAKSKKATKSEKSKKTAKSQKSKKALKAKSDSRAETVCIQVCRKGTCFKRGGKQVLQALQTEVNSNPQLQHVTVEGVGCMDACKKGPNIRLPGSKKPVSHVSPESAIARLSEYQADPQ